MNHRAVIGRHIIYNAEINMLFAAAGYIIYIVVAGTSIFMLE